MRVFTHYREVPGTNGDGVRWRTLLQFGDSWEVRGSAVMKNPGAADFRDKDRRPLNDLFDLDALNAFDDGSQKAEWYEFNADATMRAVAELFNEYYALRGERLEGVIQIFNLFYIKEVSLGKALKKQRATQLITSKQTADNNFSKYTTTQTTLSHNNDTNAPQKYPTLFENMAEYDIAHLTAPIYLGFGSLAKDKTYGSVARQFFEAAKALGMNYLHPDFDQNDFTHPLYLMNYGKNRPNSILLRSRFLRNSL